MKILRLKISESCYSISETLYIRGLLWKHKWFVLGKYGFEELVIFDRSGALTIVSGDEEEKASWVYNTKTRSLALRHLKVKVNRMLRPFFWDGCLLVFKLNAVDEYLFLVNVDKAHKLEVNPLDSFEAYAQDFMQKKETDKRRKKTDEAASPAVLLADDDPRALLATIPGPVAENFEPEPEPVEPAPAEPPVEVVPLSEVEERVRQGLEEQKRMLEKEWKKKFKEENDQLSAALWLERKEAAGRLESSLKEQAWKLELETRQRLKEQRKQLRAQEQESRGRWMKKVKLEVSMLKRKMNLDREHIQIKEESRYKRRLAEELAKMKKLYESQIRSSKMKQQTLQTELDILNSNEEPPADLGHKDAKKFDKYKRLLDGSLRYRRKLEKEVEDLNRELFAVKEKCWADIEAEKKKCLDQLERAKRAAKQQYINREEVRKEFKSTWHYHQALADDEIGRRLKKILMKDPSQKFYRVGRNVSIGILALSAAFCYFGDPILDALQRFMRGFGFSTHRDYWQISIDVAGILAIAALVTASMILTSEFVHRKFLREKVRQNYDAEYFLNLLGVKLPEEEAAGLSAPPKTPSHAAPPQSKFGKWFRMLRRRF